MSNNYRDGEGKYTKTGIVRKIGRWIKRIVIVAIVVIVLVRGIPWAKQFYAEVYIVNTYHAKDVVQAPVVVPVTVAAPGAADIAARETQVKQRADFRSKMTAIEESQATNIAITELKKEAQTRYDAAMAAYEKGLEGVRKGDLNL